jgi:hypothetical protein
MVEKINKFLTTNKLDSDIENTILSLLKYLENLENDLFLKQ